MKGKWRKREMGENRNTERKSRGKNYAKRGSKKQKSLQLSSEAHSPLRGRQSKGLKKRKAVWLGKEKSLRNLTEP